MAAVCGASGVLGAVGLCCGAGLLDAPVGGGPPASFARRVVSKPGQAPPLPTSSVGDSGETVIAFAGTCSVSGETDGTIASHIHPFSALFWCAKASWVSWRRPEVPALVLTVSSHGAVSSVGAIKFAQRDLSMLIARKYSPSAGNIAQNGRFVACRASFFAGVGGRGVCWANFVATSGTLIRPRAPPPALRSGCPVRHCPPCRRNGMRTRIVYRHPDNPSAWAQVWSSRARSADGGGGFAALEGCHRRVAGVSDL